MYDLNLWAYLENSFLAKCESHVNINCIVLSWK